MQQPRLATECCAGIFFYFQCGFVAKGAIPEGCFKLWVSRTFEVIARPLHCLHQPNGNVIAFSLGCTWNMGKGSLFWKPTCPFCIFLGVLVYCNPSASIQWNEICFTRGVLYVVFAMGLKYVKGFPFSKPTCNFYVVLFFWCCCNPSASIQWVTLFLQEGFGILFGIGMEYVEGVTIFKANM